MRLTRRNIILAALVFLTIWVLFFDTLSILTRWRWTQELDHLEQENTRLTTEIEELDHALEDVDSDEVVEKIAREEYGMRREGETVYPVKSNKDKPDQ